MPYKKLAVVWLDPTYMGRTLGKLTAIASPQSKASASDMPITVATNPSEAYDALHGIETLLGEISLKVAAYDSLWGYNARNLDDPIPHRLIVAHNVDGPQFDTRDIEILGLLIDNSSALGVQVVITIKGAGQLTDAKAQALANLKAKMAFLEEKQGRIFTIVNDVESPLLFCNDNWMTDRFFTDYAEYGQKLKESHPVSVVVDTEAEGLTIPIAQASDGDIATLRFGIEYAHAILTGTTGAGKSVFLHNVIASACTHYAPDQLVLWLVDYKKTDFGVYRNSRYRYPHIGFLGLDGSADFVGGFMKLLRHEFETRQSKIYNAEARDLHSYNNSVPPEKRMPKMLIVIDEFHTQSERMAEDDEVKQTFEQMLRESRAFGMYILISDQTLVGLNGLSQAARNQLAGRLMMKWGEISEVGEMFGAIGDMADIELEQGEIIMRSGGKLKRFMGRNMQKPQIEETNRNLPQSYWQNAPDFMCYDANKREGISLDDPRLVDPSSDIPLGIVPNFKEPTFTFSVRRRRKENIFVYSTVMEPTMSIVELIAIGMAKKRGSRIVIIGDRQNDTMSRFSKSIGLIQSACPGTLVLDTVEAVGEFFQEAHSDTFVIMIDFATMAEDMEGLPKAQLAEPEAYSEHSEDNLRAELAAMLSGGAHLDHENADSDETANASQSAYGEALDSRGLIFNEMKTGGQRSVHFCWVSDTIPNPRITFIDDSTYEDDFDALFAHRFASRCDSLKSSDLGMRGRAFEIDRDEEQMKVVYANRNAEITTIKPFIIVS